MALENARKEEGGPLRWDTGDEKSPNFLWEKDILTSPTNFHFIRRTEFSLLNGVTEVILATFGEIGLSFSVYSL